MQSNDMLAILQELVVIDKSPPIEVALPPPPHSAPPDPAVNTAANANVQLEMIRILQEMQQNTGGQSRRGGRGSGNREKNRLNPDNTNFPCCITDKYYHTHGGYNYVSSDCKRKKEKVKTTQQ